MAKESISIIERLEKEDKESNQKDALEFLNLDSKDTNILKAFALKTDDVAYFMNGDIEKLRELQREFKDDVLNIILIKPQYKDTKPLDKIAQTLTAYTKDRYFEWEFDLEGEGAPYLFLMEKLPIEKKFPIRLYKWIAHAIIEERRTIKFCAAEDCQNLFIPTPRGREQEYCSRQCYERIYSRRRYLREKKK